MIQRRSNMRPMSDINVVPYIDVMLVLLVIFMITAPLMNPGQIDLPSVGKALTPSIAPLEVIIRKDSSLALNDRSQSNQERSLTREQLIKFIKDRQTRNADQPVVISADKNVRYEEVISVMDLLQQQQIKKIGLLAQTKGR
ncbi:MAG: protein TolR [Candidatus Nitrotoga sp.]|nr:protein TolR [Candidatus Nitrotoga sp.]MBA0902113.1 protein TolR [Candidatus Nitrotoga sp.]MBP0116682.1 protein TolR [Candidatus Nitrotoga sp.]MBP0122590.1 protein TolR [Candidatus Nitrotoga sp.]MBP0126410.1 protein TolR [Candidatus Nitrotoga sp.]